LNLLSRKVSLIILAFLALVAGFVIAFMAAGVNSLFFIFIPIMAFAFGYFSTWGRGLLLGFLLFFGYTFTMMLIWRGSARDFIYPEPFFEAFIWGGFSVCLIGALAPTVRKNSRIYISIAVLVVLATVVSLCASMAVTHYGYYYQVVLESTEDLNGVDLYLPVGTVSGKPFAGLYSQRLRKNFPGPPSNLTENFTLTFVGTEYGNMLKIEIPQLEEQLISPPVTPPIVSGPSPVPNQPAPESTYEYVGNIIFWQEAAPHELIQLMPRINTISVNTVSLQHFFGPVKINESVTSERFLVPLKVISDTPAKYRLSLICRTDRYEFLNFDDYVFLDSVDYGFLASGDYQKSDNYWEQLGYEGNADGTWVLVQAEGKRGINLSAPGD
jgi:hypothetical protein